MPLPTKMRLVFGALMVVIFAWAGWQAFEFAPLAQYMPFFIGGVGALLGLVTITTDLINYRRTGTAVGGEAGDTASLGSVERELVGADEETEAAHEDEAAGGQPEPQAPHDAQAADTGEGTASGGAQTPEGHEGAELDDAARKEAERAALRRAGGYFLGIFAYVVGIWIAGIFVASAVFLIAFLRGVAGSTWFAALIGTVAILVGMVVLENLVTILWPPYLLEDLIGSFMPGSSS